PIWQRGLACVGRPDQARVCDQLQVEGDLALLTLQTRLRVVGRLARRALEVNVAAPAGPSARDDGARALAIEVGDQRSVGVECDRANGNLKRHISPVAACLAG